jgi:hypothetical protein
MATDKNAKEFYLWAKEQVYKHGTNGKITNAQKLGSKYIVNKYKTWGEVLKAAAKDYTPTTEKDVRQEYARLAQELETIPDKDNPEGRGAYIKSQMDDLVSEFQKVYSAEIGTPVSFSVAKAKLTGTDLSKVGVSGTVGEPVTLVATKTAKETADKEAKGKVDAGKTPSKTADTGTIDVSKIPTSGAAKVGPEVAGLIPTPAEGAAGPKTPSKFEDLIKRTEFWYNLPDYIFKINPALQDILVKAVDQGWTDEKFLAAAQQTPWWQQNAAAIRTRIVDKAKYDELRSQGLDVSKTDYGLDSATIKRKVADLAKQKGANNT